MNSKIKKILAVLLSAVVVMSLAFISTAADPRYERPELNKADTVKTTGTWSKDANGFWSLTSDNTKVSGGWYYANMVNSSTEYRWYHFDEKGIMSTGWVKDRLDPSIWYYTGEAKDATEGSMATGWVTDPQDGQKYYMDPATGQMSHGWVKIDNAWYYFTESQYANRSWTPDQTGYWTASKQTGHSFGSMYKNEMTPDGYYVDGTGAWRQSSGNSSSRKKPTPVMAATASTTTPQHAGQPFDKKGLTITVFKDGAAYKTVPYDDPSIVSLNVTVVGTKDNLLVAGANDIEISFVYYDPDVIIGQSMTAEVFTVDATLVYPEITGLDAALANKEVAEAARDAKTVFNIPLTLNETISGVTGGKTYSWPVQIYNVADDGTVTFGPALGENSILYNNIASTYRTWNSNPDYGLECEQANYATSRMRATLIGKDGFTPSSYADASTCLTGSNCLLSCFPESLKNNPNGSTYGIVARPMTVPTEWSTSSPYAINETATITDKLWLFSANELYGTTGQSYYDDGNSGTQMQLPENLGVTYSSYDELICNNEDGSADWRWLRSPHRENAYLATRINDDGRLSYNGVGDDYSGLAPGFCLKVLN